VSETAAQNAKTAANARRVVLLVGAAHEAKAHQWAGELVASGATVAGIVVEKRSGAVKRRMLRRRMKRWGLWRVAGQVMYRMWIATDRLRRVPGAQIAAEAEPHAAQQTPVVHVTDINDGAAERAVADWKPAVVAVYGTSIIGAGLLAALPRQTFNLHSGLVEHHRGVNSAFWALADGHPEQIGFTVHLVAPGVDTGGVVESRPLGMGVLAKAGSMRELDAMVAREGEGALVDTVKRAARGEPVEERPGGSGPVHTDPTLCGYWRVCRRFKLR
jgi:folate-dependent phosphoribosylglycinamide formyltransferase PurN